MDALISTLTVVLVMLIFFIVILVLIYWSMNNKAKREQEKEQNEEEGVPSSVKIAKEYNKKSIFKFMQFDKIEDNMIIQDGGKKYLMVIECEGVNYDLMSQVEKTAVEAGFIQFLNTLRYPIQLYTQTRTINIGESISNYKERIDLTKKELDIKQQEYNRFLKNENYNEKQANLLKKELLRVKNLYEYGKDIVDNIQKTSTNRNVLRKHYYVVVPYNSLEITAEQLSEAERKNMIFSELYTRAQSLIRALFSCEMKCKILNSNELVELLYIAYNRDESETYGIEKALKAGYNELYSTAPDVLDKRMKALDDKIEENALKLAKESIDEVKREKEMKISKKEKNFESLVRQMAEALLKENQKYIGKEIAEDAIKKISKTEEGGDINEQEEQARTRKTSTTE